MACSPSILLATYGKSSKVVQLQSCGEGHRQFPHPLTSKPGDGSSQTFWVNETRYSIRARKSPDHAQHRFDESNGSVTMRCGRG